MPGRDLKQDLELELRTKIAMEKSSIDRQLFSTQLAAYLARMGRYDDAKDLVGGIRSANSWSSAKLSAMLMYAEAMILLRNEYDDGARDRLLRAFAIASAFQEYEVSALTSAWLLQLAFNRMDLVEIHKWAGECAVRRDHMGLDCKIRFSLTQASISAFSGGRDNSEAWFRIARSLAAGTKDEASIAAAMYNRPALSIARARYEYSVDGAKNFFSEDLLMEIGSARAYSHITNNVAAKYLQSLWQGRLLMLNAKHTDALQFLGEALLSLPEAVEPHIRIGIESDVAVCHVLTDGREIAKSLLKALPVDVSAILQPDDQVVYYSQQMLLQRMCGYLEEVQDTVRRLGVSKALAEELIEGVGGAAVEAERSWLN